MLKSKRLASSAVLGSRTLLSTRGYATKPYVWVNKDTKVICQGFTGKQVRILRNFLLSLYPRSMLIVVRRVLSTASRR